MYQVMVGEELARAMTRDMHEDCDREVRHTEKMEQTIYTLQRDLQGYAKRSRDHWEAHGNRLHHKRGARALQDKEDLEADRTLD